MTEQQAAELIATLKDIRSIGRTFLILVPLNLLAVVIALSAIALAI